MPHLTIRVDSHRGYAQIQANAVAALVWGDTNAESRPQPLLMR
jgi:hypothetical protein